MERTHRLRSQTSSRAKYTRAIECIRCWTLLFPNDSAEQCVAWGSVLAIAAAVYLAYLCAFAHLSWFYAVWAVPLILSVGGFARSRWQRRISIGDLSRIGMQTRRLAS